MNTRKKTKLAAYWAAFFVLAVACVVAASLVGAELAGEPSQAGWAMAKLGSLVIAVVCLAGWICEQIED